MSAIGIDFGNESCFIAVARNGGIETVDNDYSLRATPSFVAFGDRSRSLGMSAKNQEVTNMKNTVSSFKRLLGRPFADPIVKKMIPSLPFEIVGTPTGGVGIHVRYLDEQRVFSPEQVTAMLFTKLKVTAEQALGSGTKVTNCVISVPSYFTDCERRSLLDAAKIAGLNVLRLLNDTAAAALNYGISRDDLPAPEDPKPRIVAIVDCGQSALQVGITAFHQGKLRILASCSDPFLGGRNFDRKLAAYFSAEFRNEFGVNVEENKRAYLRLLAEVEKLKKQMSVSGNRMPLKIEALMEDTDVEGALSRDQFEEMCWSLFGRVERVLRRCLGESRLGMEDVHSVEVIGGGTRMPMVRGLIEKVFGEGKVKKTLNQDEAVARGCGMMGLLMSPEVNVGQFEVKDWQGYGIRVVWDKVQGEGGDGDVTVFHRGAVVPGEMWLSMVRKEGFGLRAEYVGEGWGQEGWLPWATRSIGSWRVIWNGNKEAKGERVVVKCELDGNGIFGVGGARVSEKVVDGDGKEVSKATELRVTGITFGLGERELDMARESEVEMVKRDEEEKERLDVRNGLEAFTYEVRGKLGGGGEWEGFVEESERKKMLEELVGVEAWLYDGGDKEQKQVFQDKWDELKAMVEPIKNRKLEGEAKAGTQEVVGSVEKKSGGNKMEVD